MAGIYFHIPFCKQACHYCDFHFSTSLRFKKEMLGAMQLEIRQRKHLLENEKIETIYFGGGTPSILASEEIKLLLEICKQNFSISENPEITLEANPDDLTEAKIQELKTAGINRLSIGIQSFRDEDLRWMNRAHVAVEAEAAVKNAQKAGIANITIDLIYGIPGMSNEEWKLNLEKAIALNVPHISAYCLTVENGTALWKQVEKKISHPVDDDLASEQFEIMVEKLRQNDFVHYEISNFAKPGFFSRHNSAYWKGVPYLGIGPSAHSYIGKQRSGNLSNNKRYIDAVNSETGYNEVELLTEKQMYNEYILTGLRTMWGVEERVIEERFGKPVLEHFLSAAGIWKTAGSIIVTEGNWKLSPDGKLLADKIASELFL